MAEQQTPEQLVEVLRSEQCARWQEGEHVPVENYLRAHPVLNNDPPNALKLVYQEVLLREEEGESPQPDEYVRRFPQFAAQLGRLFEVHRGMDWSQLLRTGAPETPRHSRPPGSSRTVAARWPVVAGYDILGVLGRGGMGVVYQARHLRLNRLVALKMILPGAHTDLEEQARFRREAKMQARLQHPHIVQIFEVGEDACPYLALEYVDGGSLAQKLAGTPQPARPAAALLATLARTVHAAHQCDLIHRDLKPANVLLTADGTPKITDFGLAKRLEGETGTSLSGGPSQGGFIVGTPSYMAPEQADDSSKHKRREAVGPATDVYALGAILYEMLTGRPPFKGETPLNTLLQMRSQDPIPPSRLRLSVPRDLETICLKCLEKVPARRYGSAEALAEDLERWLDGKPIQARPSTTVERLVKWSRRRPALTALVGVSGVAALALVGLLVGLVFHTRLQAAFQETEQARQDEHKQRQRAEQAQQDEAQARKGEAHYLYFSKILLAQREWSANNVARARQLLDECPAEQRGWEWHYLKRQCLASPLPLQDAPDLAGSGGAFSLDGKRFAAAHKDTVIVWNTAEGKQMSLLQHDQPVRRVALSPKGELLATASDDRRVKLWDVEKAKEIHPFPPLSGVVHSLVFAPGGQRLAAGTADGNLVIWDVKSYTRQVLFKTESGPVTSLAFGGPKGQFVATAGRNVEQGKTVTGTGVVKIWRPATKTLVHSLSGHEGAIRDLAFSADGERLASTSIDRTVRLWDTTSGEKIFSSEHTQAVHSLAFSPNRQRLALGGADGSVMVCDLAANAANRELIPLRGHMGPVLAVTFRSNQELLSASMDRTLNAWNLTTVPHEARTLRGHGDSVTALAFSPDGQHLASGGEDGIVKLWDPTAAQELRTLPVQKGSIRDLAFGPPAGRRLACATAAKVVEVWDTKTGDKLFWFTPPKAGPVRGVAFEPAGDHLAFVTEWDKKSVVHFRVNDANKPHPKRSDLLLPHWQAWTLAFSPDGQRFATAGSDGYLSSSHVIVVWNVVSYQKLLSLGGHTGPITRVTFSPDGKLLASASRDQTVKLWDAATGQEVFTLRGHTHGVTSVAFSPDGRRLASASEDGTVKLWDVAAGHETLTLRGHTGPVRSVAFSPDGRLLASGGDDGSVKIWNAIPLP